MSKMLSIENFKLVDWEWLGVMILMGYTFLKSELLYENTGFQKYIYITFATFMFFIISLAKLKIFNIFNIIHNIPKYLKLAWNYFIEDYKYWKLNKVRKHE